uniref:hypothetical protein n=1 Tax=Streptomyces polyasparticus TaxID=2767826 RepID=UPI00280BABD6|nr:hypothetical protein [Streptomyces polyasparticus]
MTRNHIDVWHTRAMPSGAVRISFRTVLRCSLLPLVIWTGIACFAYVVYHPVVAMVLGAILLMSFCVGFGLRRTAGHSVRCSAYGAFGGVLDKSMAGF